MSARCLSSSAPYVEGRATQYRCMWGQHANSVDNVGRLEKCATRLTDVLCNLQLTVTSSQGISDPRPLT